MPVPALSTISMEGGVAAALQALPDAPGIVQLLAAEGRNLIVGRGASIRSWAAHRLGAGPKPKPGRRPPLDLSAVTHSLRYALTFTEFGQLLAFERLMASASPPPPRPELKPPWWIQLDLSARFPRLTVVPDAAGAAYGPYRSRDAAQKAVDALNATQALRPCTYEFEPHPELPLGVQCLFAQTRSCSAPCLCRIDEAGYREAALRAALALAADPGPADRRGLVVEERADGMREAYPVNAGRVLEAQSSVLAEDDELPAVRWTEGEGDDWPWLMPWLAARRRKGRWISLV